MRKSNKRERVASYGYYYDQPYVIEYTSEYFGWMYVGESFDAFMDEVVDRHGR